MVRPSYSEHQVTGHSAALFVLDHVLTDVPLEHNLTVVAGAVLGDPLWELRAGVTGYVVLVGHG